MTLWIILTIMTALAAVAAAAPFLRRLDAPKTPQSEDVEVYRDQLKEIEREEKSGLIEAHGAGEARKEIARRLIAAERVASAVSTSKPQGDRWFAAIGVASAVAISSTILYANMGWPDLPAQPAASRMARAQTQRGVEPASNATEPSESAEAAAEPATAPGQKGAGTVDEMIERLVQRLKENPNNADGWRMLGWSYFSQERYVESAAAYGKAIEQSPAGGALKTARGEALVRAAGGMVTDETIVLFDEAIKLDAKDPRARFFLGLKKVQTGNKSGALDDWITLLNEAGANDPWAGDLKSRVSELAGELKIDITSPVTSKAVAAAPRGGILDAIQVPNASSQATAPNQAAATSAPGGKGPSPEDVKKAEGMTAEDRTAMIRGMVDGLQDRLEKSPRDADGWIKLIRSRKVMGEAAAAKDSLSKALAVFADAPEEKDRIAAAAKELGVEN